MYKQDPYLQGKRPRASSDTYTTTPLRTARRDEPRSRHVSDATQPEHVVTQRPAPPHSNLARDSERRRLSLDVTDTERAANRQYAFASLNRNKDAGPAVPPRTYESPASQSRAAFRESNLSPSISAFNSPQFERSHLSTSHVSDLPSPSAAAENSYLPSYNRFDTDQTTHQSKGEPFLSRVREFYVKITQEPPLPSPPPTPGVSHGSSFAGNATMNGKFDEPQDEFERDMLVRAMQLNGDTDAHSSLAADADIQLYTEPVQDVEGPFFLNSIETDAKSDGNGKKRALYRLRRKKPKHRIIRSQDTEDAQHRFIIVLARALMEFGSPSHRIEPQLASLAALFELTAQFVHSPGCVQISFGNPEAHLSETLLVKANEGLDLGRIHDTHAIYRAVARDEITATEGRRRLEEIIRRKPIYSKKFLLLLTFVQGFILCGSSFRGSINDMWVSGVLSVLVMLAQLYSTKSQLKSSGADIFTAGIVSLVSRALSTRVPGQIFCYQAISSASIAGLLPGSLMLAGVLDIASKNIYLGAPKVVSGLMTSLYLGFGLTLGSDVWLHFDKRGQDHVSSLSDRFETFSGVFVSANVTTPDWLSPDKLTGIWSFQETSSAAVFNVVSGCHRDPSWKWWFQPLPWYSLFALLPILNLVLSMKRAQPLLTVEMPVMILISCTSSAVTYVANNRMALAGHPDYTALLGSFVVSLLGNIYSRTFGGTAFTIMLTGIWLLIPTGLAEAGGLSSTYIAPGQDEYTESLELARKMISVIIGVMSGVYLSARLLYAFGKRKNSAFVTF